MSPKSLRRLTGVAVACVAAATVVATAPPAGAVTNLNVTYDAVGSSTIAKTNSTVALGPTQLSASITPSGSFTGSLPLPATSTSFKALGLLPVKATVNFVPAAPLTGQLVSTPQPSISSVASYYVKLSNVTVAGIPAFVGNSCQTKDPVSISAATPAGQTFNVATGGTLTGTYTIGSFSKCGLTTFLINQLVPGPNNAVTLTVSNGRLGT